MHFTCETNARSKFDRWLTEHPPAPVALEPPHRPAAFTPRHRIKALTEPVLAEIYVLQTPDRPAA